MKRPIRIRFSGMESTSELYAAARSYAQALAWDDSEIIECWVGIRRDLEKTRPRPRYSVRIDISVPGHELVAKKVLQEYVDFALGHAFEDMRLQLAGIDPCPHHAEQGLTLPLELVAEDFAEEKRYGERRRR